MILGNLSKYFKRLIGFFCCFLASHQGCSFFLYFNNYTDIVYYLRTTFLPLETVFKTYHFLDSCKEPIPDSCKEQLRPWGCWVAARTTGLPHGMGGLLLKSWLSQINFWTQEPNKKFERGGLSRRLSSPIPRNSSGISLYECCSDFEEHRGHILKGRRTS